MKRMVKTTIIGAMSAALLAAGAVTVPAQAQAAGPVAQGPGTFQLAQWGGPPPPRGWQRPGGWRGGYGHPPPRYRGWRGPGYYGGNYYYDPGAALAAGVIGLAAGAIIAGAANQQRYVGNDYLAYCSQRYRSFNPATGTYPGYDGRQHRCVMR